jgi:protein LTV1
MVKKKFIDKKKSVTYNLVYRSTEDADAPPERTLMEAGRGGAAAGQPDVEAAAEAHQTSSASTRRYPPGHPLAWIEDQELQGEMTDERRRELVELGFPDDGYDYLRHVRTLGMGAGSLEGLVGKQHASENQDEEGKAAAAVAAAAAATAAKEAALLAIRAETTDAILGGKGPAKVKVTGPVGPSVFMKATALQQPDADVAVFDAAGLRVLQPTDIDEEATEMMGGVTAFSRKKDAEDLGAERRDIEELEELMRTLEADDDLDVLEEEREGTCSESASAAAGATAAPGVARKPVAATGARDELGKKSKDGVRVKGRVLGEGDLLDDFILTATQGNLDSGVVVGNDTEEEEESSSIEEYSEEEEESRDDVYAGLGAGRSNGNPPSRPGSIASTYWREERTDRKNLLGVIDERFEQLALEYDEDEIGSMEDEADAGAIQGFADVSEFDTILNQFLEERKADRGGADLDEDYFAEEEEEDTIASTTAADSGEHEHGSEHEQQQHVKASKKPVQRRRRGESVLKARLEAAGYDDTDAEVAITAARAALRRMGEEESLGINTTVDVFEIRKKEVDPTAGWDCESVLSLRSNLYNHPGTITEPGRSRKAPPSGLIRLNKDGIPMGVLPSKYAQQQQGQHGQEDDGVAGGRKKSVPAVVVERKKGESAEEKRARKNAVKEMKRDARATKKELKTLYKEESVKAQRRAATAQVQPSVLL